MKDKKDFIRIITMSNSLNQRAKINNNKRY